MIQNWESSTDLSFSSPTTITNSTTTYEATNLTATTYYRAVVKSGVCDIANSAIATVTVDAASVGGTLSGSGTVCTGTNSTFLVLSGHTGTIQNWESSTDIGFSSPTTIANTTTSYIAEDLTSTTYYRAVVKSGVCVSANSSIATVTVDAASAGGSVSGTTMVCTGTNSTTLTLSGHTGTIQNWESSTDLSFSSPTIIMNTTTSYIAEDLTSTTYYRAVVKSGVCDIANSAIATVTVDAASVGGSVSGTTTVCTGTNSTTLVLSGHRGMIQNWESSTDLSFSSPTTITNTTTSYVATNLTATTYYRAVVKSGVCDIANSAIATVTVDAASVGGTITFLPINCDEEELAKLTLNGHIGSILKWQSSETMDFMEFTEINNTSNMLTVENMTESTFFRAIVKSGICAEVASEVVAVAMNPIFGEEGDGSLPCPEKVSIPGVFNRQVPTGTYRAASEITSSAIVMPGNTVTYKAGESIILHPCFHATAGSNFHAVIESCVIPKVVIENDEIVEQAFIEIPTQISQEPLTFKVSPNPFVDQAKLNFRLPQDDLVSIQVFDQAGRMIKQPLSLQKLVAGDYEILLTNEQFQGGMYYVILQTSTERIVKKVILIQEGRYWRNDD